jgi:hypothetical protein
MTKGVFFWSVTKLSADKIGEATWTAFALFGRVFPEFREAIEEDE